MKTTSITQLVTGALCALIASQAMAQQINDPPPDLDPGKETRHLFTVPGTINHPHLETLITCTSLESETIKIGVQFYNEQGVASNDPLSGDGVLDVPSGWTITVATGNAVGLPLFSQGFEIATVNFGVGSARVIATGKKVVCTARMVSTEGDPPTVFDTITLIKAKKQSGD